MNKNRKDFSTLAGRCPQLCNHPNMYRPKLDHWYHEDVSLGGTENVRHVLELSVSILGRQSRTCSSW